MDKDCSGGVDYEEFIAWLRDGAPADVNVAWQGEVRNGKRDVILACFRAVDADGSGVISALELLAGLQRACPSVPENHLRELLAVLDKHCHGHIDYGDFLDLIYDCLPHEELAAADEASPKGRRR